MVPETLKGKVRTFPGGIMVSYEKRGDLQGHKEKSLSFLKVRAERKFKARGHGPSLCPGTLKMVYATLVEEKVYYSLVEEREGVAKVSSKSNP